MSDCCSQTISMAPFASGDRGSCWSVCQFCEGKGTIIAACHLDNQPNRAGRDWLVVARYLSCKLNLLIYQKILFLYTWYEICTYKLFKIFIMRIRVCFHFGKSLQF